MDKGINIRSVLLLKKAVEILDYLGTKYDIEKLRKRLGYMQRNNQ